MVGLEEAGQVVQLGPGDRLHLEAIPVRDLPVGVPLLLQERGGAVRARGGLRHLGGLPGLREFNPRQERAEDGLHNRAKWGGGHHPGGEGSRFRPQDIRHLGQQESRIHPVQKRPFHIVGHPKQIWYSNFDTKWTVHSTQEVPSSPDGEDHRKLLREEAGGPQVQHPQLGGQETVQTR